MLVNKVSRSKDIFSIELRLAFCLLVTFIGGGEVKTMQQRTMILCFFNLLVARRSCPANYVTCFNHRCVSNKVKCNGLDDCGDGTDEIYDCDVSHCNSTTEFTCAGKQCIPLTEVCDGESITMLFRVISRICFGMVLRETKQD